jgi:tetratricopeptide (TPR) repeat protein
VTRLRWRNDPRANAAGFMLAAADGQDDLARGALDAAERELREAIDLGVQAFGARSPFLTPVRTNLARVLEPNDPDAAAVMLAASLDVDAPGWPTAIGELTVAGRGAEASALIDVGWKLYAVGRDEEALTLIRKARALAGAMPPMFAMMVNDLESEVAVARGDLATARVLNDRAFAALGPSAIPAHTAGLRVTRAEILEASGDDRAAAAEYRAALEHLDRSPEGRQFANVGIARCLFRMGEAASARKIVEDEVASGLIEPRLRPSTLLLLADLRWRAGERRSAHAAARDAAAAVQRLPALVADRKAVEVWLAAHPITD